MTIVDTLTGEPESLGCLLTGYDGLPVVPYGHDTSPAPEELTARLRSALPRLRCH